MLIVGIRGKETVKKMKLTNKMELRQAFDTIDAVVLCLSDYGLSDEANMLRDAGNCLQSKMMEVIKNESNS